MGRAMTCPTCHYDDHHATDCPEMSFPSGQRRDEPGPANARTRLPAIAAMKVRIFVPVEITPLEGQASTAAATFAYYACAMATPVLEAVRAVVGGHVVDLRETGDVAARAAALLEKG